MVYSFKKEDFSLETDAYSACYEFENEAFIIQISEADFSDEEVMFTNQLVNLYEKNLPNIAIACVESDTFKYCYPHEDVDSIPRKLGKPIFRRMGKTTMLTYVEHTIDYDHILDIEFEGLYDDIFSVGIDG